MALALPAPSPAGTPITDHHPPTANAPRFSRHLAGERPVVPDLCRSLRLRLGHIPDGFADQPLECGEVDVVQGLDVETPLPGLVLPQLLQQRRILLQVAHEIEGEVLFPG